MVVETIVNLHGGVRCLPLVKFFNGDDVKRSTVFNELVIMFRSENQKGSKIVVATTEEELEEVGKRLDEAKERNEDVILKFPTQEKENGIYTSPCIHFNEMFEAKLEFPMPVMTTVIYFLNAEGKANIRLKQEQKKRARSVSPNAELSAALRKPKGRGKRK